MNPDSNNLFSRNVLIVKAHHITRLQTSNMTDCIDNFPGDDFPNADSLIQAIFDAQEEEEAGQGHQQGQSHNPGSSEAAGESQSSSTQKSKSTTHCMLNMGFYSEHTCIYYAF